MGFPPKKDDGSKLDAWNQWLKDHGMDPNAGPRHDGGGGLFGAVTDPFKKVGEQFGIGDVGGFSSGFTGLGNSIPGVGALGQASHNPLISPFAQAGSAAAKAFGFPMAPGGNLFDPFGLFGSSAPSAGGGAIGQTTNSRQQSPVGPPDLHGLVPNYVPPPSLTGVKKPALPPPSLAAAPVKGWGTGWR